jgi:2-succinyl-5-enolpyruvyl-6-hydroxy-3-cyclohexene-1-carboxylate synthase
MTAEPWGEVLAAHLALTHPAFAGRIQVASSMPVRHANLHARGPVACNRGVNGIDGTIGTYIGATLAAGGASGLLLCGDLAFLHDLPALAAAPALRRSALVVLNNQGGGIFDFLPVARVPEYQRWVRTPHRLDFAHAAAQFGLGYDLVADRAALGAALDRAAAEDRPRVIECAVGGSDTVARHRALLRLLGE